MPSQLKSIGQLFTSLSIALLLFSSSFTACSQENCKNTFIIGFYNLENLFDTIDNPATVDEEYTPQGKKQWNTKRYKEKLEHIGRVLSSFPCGNPVLMGVCEAENVNVLNDLVKQPILKSSAYKIVHYESPDFRGIDVALLYNPNYFKPVYSRAIKVSMTDDPKFTTRDILYVKGIFQKKDTLNIFVNHWPSRLGGKEKAALKRAAAASTLKTQTDSLFRCVSTPKIILMGDLNDEPADSSVAMVLNALPTENITGKSLYNLAYVHYKNHTGSYYFSSDNHWDMFDQIIVSGFLLEQGQNLVVGNSRQEIHKPEWILYKTKNGVWVPSKTYAGDHYTGGFSDHLPVYIRLIKTK